MFLLIDCSICNFSFQDFTGNDRQKEEKYMERTDEVIYQRAAEEHIRRPPLWHDDEVDSVRVSSQNFTFSLQICHFSLFGYESLVLG